jgi:uncharacterized beta-barrel protein YwiB (DUF1934 family)
MKDIMLRITGSQITADMEEDRLEFITEGKLFEEDEAVCLTYEESEFSGMPGCRTKLSMGKDSITMKRIGEHIGLDTEIEFEKGRRYKGYYDTPYGAVEMEVLTNELTNNLMIDGTIDIDYDISLKGLVEGRNRLNIELM